MMLQRAVLRRVSKHHIISGLSTFKPQYGLYINGKYNEPSSCKTFAVNNPATGAHLTNVVSADATTVDTAIDIAHTTYESGVWSRSDVRYTTPLKMRLKLSSSRFFL